MYIVAAVDVDVREAKRVAKMNASAPERGGGGAAQRGSEWAGSRWRKGDEGRINVHEQVVCSIKAHQNGTLEVAPGVCVHAPRGRHNGAATVAFAPRFVVPMPKAWQSDSITNTTLRYG